MDGEFVIVDKAGNLLNDTIYPTLEAAKADKPDTHRVIFKHQLRRFQHTGCTHAICKAS